MPSQHLGRADLEAGLAAILDSPHEAGRLAMIVRRPGVDQREEVEAASLSVAEGLVGDNWRARRHAHPDRQLTIMNSRAAALVAQNQARWSLAGDQLYVDLDLSLENLPPGSRLRLGPALVEVTAVPHRGCRKFVDRFGKAAMEFVNSDTGCRLNLRGVNAKVIAGGEIRREDVVTVEKRGVCD